MSILAALSARAVILLNSGDPLVNTSAPTGALANSGWQYEGSWVGFLGTVIAPHFFITAKHFGIFGAGSVFKLQGGDYHTVASFADPASDLVIYQVSETFPVFSPLYTKQDEVGKHVVAIGRGTQRGNARTFGVQLRGWDWGPGDQIKRWGENIVSSIYNTGVENDLLRSAFDQNGLANECTLSNGDSGGGAFISDGGVWKLAGIHYAVDDPFYTAPSASTKFDAALFDMSDFYESPDNGATFNLITGPPPIPAGFYPTRISTKLAWIYSVIDPTGDLDGDGIPNLMEYALHLDPLAPDAAGLPRVGREGNFLTLTYSKVTTATDITYTVLQSSDLSSWSTATTQNDILSTNGNVQTIKARIDIGTSTHLFAELRVTRP